MTIFQASGMPITSSFGRVYAKGVEDAAKRYGVEITNLGFTGEYTEQKAIEFLNTAIASKPDAIITSVYDPHSWEAPLKKAEKEGIVVADTNASDPRPAGERDPYLFYTGENAEAAGVMAAETMLAHKKPRRAICAVQFPGSSIIQARCKGFIGALKAAGVATEVVTVSPSDPVKASQTTQAYLQAHPETEAIFSMSPLGGAADADGIAQGVSEAKDHGKVDIIYNGTSKQTLSAVASGKALATLDQQVYLQGYLAVEFLYLYHQYGFVPGRQEISTGPVVVDKSNVKEFEKGAEEGVRG